MTSVPPEIEGASVLCAATLDDRCRWTGLCRHHRDGIPLDVASFLAICETGGIYYLFGCDSTWCPQSETRHWTLDEAKAQAEYEYDGIGKCWVDLALLLPPP